MKKLICSMLMTVGAVFASTELSSPNGKVVARIFEDGGHLAVSVERDGQTILHSSPIGIVLDGVDLGGNAKVVSQKSDTINERYQWNGNHSTAINQCNGTKFNLKTKAVEWTLDVRAYNDGVAFRFSSDKAKVLFNGESTVLNFAPSLTAKAMRHKMGEESRVYTLPVTELAGQKFNRTLPPLLMFPEDASHYIMVLEGGGFGFHGYSLLAQEDAAFKVDYAEMPDGWKIEGGVETAWKIICTVDSLNELVNTDLVANVCPPPDPKLFPRGVNEEWIKPGKSTWNWWARLSVDFETQKMLVDKAAEMGAQYHLVDIGWDQAKTWQDHTQDPYDYLKMLCDYGAKKGVGIFVWKCSDTTFNLKTDSQKALAKFQKLKPVQVSRQIDQMRSEVKRIADAGAKGIKLDYIASENSHWKTYMENFLKV